MHDSWRGLVFSVLGGVALAARAAEPASDLAGTSPPLSLQTVLTTGSAFIGDMPLSQPVAMIIGILAAAAFMLARRQSR
jgi:hypothetical protein